LLEALRYKPQGRGFNSLWCHWNFSLTLSFRQHYGPGVNSASNENEYQEYFLGGKRGRCLRLTTLPPSCADCLEILEASASRNPVGLSGPVGLALPHPPSREHEGATFLRKVGVMFNCPTCHKTATRVHNFGLGTV
jgi:hypothetical protein